MQPNDIINTIYEQGVIGIMRADSSDKLLAAAAALLEGGIRIIEVTMTTPGAIEVLKDATAVFGDRTIFGVGSVLDTETARAAILAGAAFIVTPVLDVGTIKICRKYSIPIITGAFTPTEIIQAWQAGADFVKVFPANFFGPSYIKAVNGPLPQVRLIPVGGVNLENSSSYIRNGAAALGVGSSLINNDLLENGKLKDISEKAHQFILEVKKGRGIN